MNELHHETSPYLLQHANNPVHWKAWSDKNLTDAKTANKLIIVSIGYSACHWCHVMEHESFEDTEVAQTMNQHFINLKVDREERPDVDAIYMKAVQIMTKRGGWPLNCVCLPDGRPIWGGTYFRKNEWIDTLEQLQTLFEQQPEKMFEYAEKLHQGIEAIHLTDFENKGKVDLQHIHFLIAKWQKSFDWEFGGYARAPKFMMPNNYQFLLQYAHFTKNSELLEYVNLTLAKMGYGGIFDIIDGGFSRYSVDMKWHIPHFEKMLYDNAQLVSLFSEAYKLTQNQYYKEIVEKTLQFIEREWFTSFHGFYSSFDADSLDENQQLEEGAFYVWTKENLQEIFQEDFDLFCQVFNINEFGHWEKGNYVLIQNDSLASIALKNSISEETLVNKKAQWEKTLFIIREERSKPRLDDKCLTSWNAMMLLGFIDAYKAFQNPKHLEIALKNATFIEEKLWHPEGHLFHNFKNQKATINGFLEDYSFTIQAFIALYQVTFNEKWLDKAKNLTLYCLDHFYDEKSKFFQFTSRTDTPLVHVHYEIEDNVIPASNSVMTRNLLDLSVYFENTSFETIALQMLGQIIPNIDYPSAFSNWLLAWLQQSQFRKELAICGKDAFKMIREFQHNYFPQLVIAAGEKPSNLPFLQQRYQENETLIYVCQNKSCLAPTKNINEALEILNSES
jgi:uncharacterized protein YyaL (SSP411 family)